MDIFHLYNYAKIFGSPHTTFSSFKFALTVKIPLLIFKGVSQKKKKSYSMLHFDEHYVINVKNAGKTSTQEAQPSL